VIGGAVGWSSQALWVQVDSTKKGYGKVRDIENPQSPMPIDEAVVA